MKEVLAKGNITRAMKGDAYTDTLTYLPIGEVVNTVLVVRVRHGKARDTKQHGMT